MDDLYHRQSRMFRSIFIHDVGSARGITLFHTEQYFSCLIVEDIPNQFPRCAVPTEYQLTVISGHPRQDTRYKRFRAHSGAVFASIDILPVRTLNEQIEPVTAVSGPLKLSGESPTFLAKAHTQFSDVHLALDFHGKLKPVTIRQFYFRTIIPDIEGYPFIW